MYLSEGIRNEVRHYMDVVRYDEKLYGKMPGFKIILKLAF